MISALSVLAFLLTSFWAQGEPTGQISGQLTNATPNGAQPAGATVTLASLTQAGWQTERTTTTDAQGRFTFDGLPRVAGTVYLPIAAFDGAWYYPAEPVEPSESPDAPVQITVYDGTRTDEALRYDRAAMLIAGVQPEALNVMEMSGLSNTEPKTVVGADPAAAGRGITARFPLPTGAIGFQPQRGMIDSQLVPTAEGVALAWPIFPGRQELAFSYQLPYSGDRVAIDKVLAYPVGTFSVYVPEGGLELMSDQLKAQGTTELGGRTYRLYTANELNRGDRVTAQLIGIGAALNPPAAPSSYTAPLMVASGVTLLATGVGLAFMWRRRAGTRQAEPKHGRESLVPVELPERQKLIAEIAALDERFEQRLLPEGAYRETRAALMSRVVALTSTAAPNAHASERSAPIA